MHSKSLNCHYGVNERDNKIKEELIDGVIRNSKFI